MLLQRKSLAFVAPSGEKYLIFILFGAQWLLLLGAGYKYSYLLTYVTNG